MSQYPRTDKDWYCLAECIVTKHTSVSPEEVGRLTINATQVIFSWYDGEQANRASEDRQYARDRLMALARETGCTVNTGQEMMHQKMHGGSVGWTYATVGRTQMRGRNTHTGIEIEQVSHGYDQLDIDTATKRITEALGSVGGEMPDRKFPKTYDGWVELALDIKEKMPPGAWSIVNNLLQVIEEGGPEAEEAKRWLIAKAGELGIT